MVIILREIYLPAMIFCIIMEFELSFYFLFQYYKQRDEKLSMNIILLSFSLLFGFGATGFIFLIMSSYYINNLIIANILLKIGIFLLLFAVLLFLITLLSKSFNEFVNPILVIVISIIIIIAAVSLIFVDIDSFEFTYILLSGLIGGFYMINFQRKLIKLTTGEVKNKFIIIIAGELFVAGGMGFGSGLSTILQFQMFEEIFYLISVYIIILGLIIMFYGIFRFPVILEFNWVQNLRKLYIIDQEKLTELYTFDFTNSNNKIIVSKKNPDVMKTNNMSSIGIIGINEIFSSITNTDKLKIKKIKQGESFIHLEYGDEPLSYIIFIVLAEKKMTSVNFFLKIIKKQFQSLYKDFLINNKSIEGYEKELFSSFDIIIKNILK
ncbi:MAG: hypothetical protein KAT66_09330 [Candidatus Lokiarchaeota archaeon]|nr:hypothetical protein [Candidatus Lokiarchaeota archaeon]